MINITIFYVRLVTLPNNIIMKKYISSMHFYFCQNTKFSDQIQTSAALPLGEEPLLLMDRKLDLERVMELACLCKKDLHTNLRSTFCFS
jgi:hypothetical protein